VQYGHAGIPILHEAAIQHNIGLHCSDMLIAMQLTVQSVLYVLHCCCCFARCHEGCNNMLTRHVPCMPPSSHSTHAVTACTKFNLCESTPQCHATLSSNSPIIENCDIAYPMPVALFSAYGSLSSVEQSPQLSSI